MGWTEGLEGWYAEHGRHALPWRSTRDPWAVLVSEVMLQQTSVTRVLPRWERFLVRWPDASACAAATLDDVLREWDGLGYPRRARALWGVAKTVTERGWPVGEEGLRDLPGVGAYTARALMAFAFDPESPLPPRDVNLGRVAARAAIGCDPADAPAAALDAAIVAGRPSGLPMRDYAYALFDVGALLCRARTAACAACPLTRCASRRRVVRSSASPRQPRYRGSMRELRGEILRALLSPAPPESADDLAERLAGAAALRRPGALAEALAGLADDGLIDAAWRPVA